MNIEQLESSQLDRLKRIQATNYLAHIVLHSMNDCRSRKDDSPTKELFLQITPLLPDQFLNTKRLKGIPEAKVLCFVDSQNFITLISEIDAFLYDTLLFVLMLHPEKMGNQQISLKDVINSTSTSTILRSAVDNYVHHIMYKSPNEYRKIFLNILSADDNFLKTNWAVYVEAKARRDIGVHNDWVVNTIYNDKVTSNDKVANGQHLTITSEYLIPTQSSLIELMQDIVDYCKIKFRTKG